MHDQLQTVTEADLEPEPESMLDKVGFKAAGGLAKMGAKFGGIVDDVPDSDDDEWETAGWRGGAGTSIAIEPEQAQGSEDELLKVLVSSFGEDTAGMYRKVLADNGFDVLADVGMASADYLQQLGMPRADADSFFNNAKYYLWSTHKTAASNSQAEVEGRVKAYKRAQLSHPKLVPEIVIQLRQAVRPHMCMRTPGLPFPHIRTTQPSRNLQVQAESEFTEQDEAALLHKAMQQVRGPAAIYLPCKPFH